MFGYDIENIREGGVGRIKFDYVADKIFFCGVPGSRWSGIAQEIKARPGYNTSDRAEHRKYEHGKFSGHIDAYFGTGMEFEPSLEENNLLAPFSKKRV